jgi:serine/threonine protein kinase
MLGDWPMHDPDRDPLDLIAEEFADRCRRGETPSIAEYVAKHPNFANDLRDLLPAVAQIERLKTVRRAAPAPLPTDGPPPQKLGDFRIVREIGRGGMGIVYEAVQESLGRRVALKLLPTHARTDPTKRERFLREAHAAAKLHHTNIVPVFGVGEEKGVPYYVMQYIPGCGLHDVIAGWRGEPPHDPATAPYRPTTPAVAAATAPVVKSPLPRPGDWSTIARIGRAAAAALQEAHDQGVLHRDVKPGNLLLDPRGHVWVTDFGLAKLADQDALTATGDVMGTLQYMAPEALRGQTDHRADVYGLGMTLYELITLRLPFDESNPAILVKEITEKDPLPPRQVNPKIPRDLETIVLTAIAREPERRYASAAALADDLEAFIEDRPIKARRLGPIGRGWRWCRKNPVVAGLSAVTAAAVLFAAVFGWVMYAKAAEALDNEKDALTKVTDALAKEQAALAKEQAALAEESLLRAEAQAANRKLADNLALSLEAFEKVFDAANPEPLFPGFRRGGPGGPPGRPPEGRPPERAPGPAERREPDDPPGGRSPMWAGGIGLPAPFDAVAALEPAQSFFNKFAQHFRRPDPNGMPGRGPGPGPGPRDRGGPDGPGERGLGRGGFVPMPTMINPVGVLEPVLDFYDKFAQQNATNPRLQLDAARAYLRVGEMQDFFAKLPTLNPSDRRERQEKSNMAFTRAAAITDDLYRQFPEAQDVRRELLLAYSQLPLLEPNDPGFRNRLEGFRRAAAIGEELRATNPRFAAPLAHVYRRLADMLDRDNQIEAAAKARRTADALDPFLPQTPWSFGRSQPPK